MTQDRPNVSDLEYHEEFIHRHIGPHTRSIHTMLNSLGLEGLDELMEKTVPSQIRMDGELELPLSVTEEECLQYIRHLADKNEVFKNYIGLGYYGCHTPKVILRNILENPGWYTAYTPYQAEISQGRMEALLNFQTMIIDLTGMEIANASLLDEGTAAAEAMSLALGRGRKQGNVFWAADDNHPQVLAVLETRCKALGVELVVADVDSATFDQSVFGALLAYPSTDGRVRDYTETIQKIHDGGAMAVVAADLLALTILKSPGEMGADVVVGSAQRFGVPLGAGGPHAAFMAAREKDKRSMPGRIIGVSKDSRDQPALRLALQTREQHIRREKATSNICTAQVLLAVMAGMYAVYHGPKGIRRIGRRVHRLTTILGEGLKKLGFSLRHGAYFDTLAVELDSDRAKAVIQRAQAKKINLRQIDEKTLGVSLDETTTRVDVEELAQVFADRDDLGWTVADLDGNATPAYPEKLARTTPYLAHPVFHNHHSETEMLRYISRLQEKDIALNRSMIPLGSCTMKLNATAEMIPVTWPEIGGIHPFAPLEQMEGYRLLIGELEDMLSEITGFSAVSLQPNSGAQGEYAGLLVIDKYHQSRGQGHRNICLIPSSAHGTNPASAVMAGMKVVVVKCDDQGNIDVADLKAQVEKHRDNLSALMVTYPSTHGVFEESIVEICEIIHEAGGQVYMDGANLNAMVGICRPGKFGPDVAHLNLHKTFCIPHGGGGPGVGPIGVVKHLTPYLPSHPLQPAAGPETGIGPITSAPWGSAGILPISWGYIKMMGRDGLKKATQVAVLNANYMARRLSDHYSILYTGKNGMVAHECIIDTRPFQKEAGINVDDIAKRLMDFGFHAPTMSWPVAGTLMIEPTESESKEELDRFCDAMITIREEIKAVAEGRLDKEDNPLKNAPHPAEEIMSDEWSHPYSRQQAAYPLDWVKDWKYWPPVARVDNVFGDRNFVCSCAPIESYQEQS